MKIQNSEYEKNSFHIEQMAFWEKLIKGTRNMNSSLICWYFPNELILFLEDLLFLFFQFTPCSWFWEDEFHWKWMKNHVLHLKGLFFDDFQKTCHQKRNISIILHLENLHRIKNVFIKLVFVIISFNWQVSHCSSTLLSKSYKEFQKQ